MGFLNKVNKVGYETRLFPGGPGTPAMMISAIQAPKTTPVLCRWWTIRVGECPEAFVPEVSRMSFQGENPHFQGRKWVASGRVREWCKSTPEASMYRGIFTKPFPLVHVYRSFTYIMWVKNPYMRRIWDGIFMLDVCAFGIANVVDMIRIPA